LHLGKKHCGQEFLFGEIPFFRNSPFSNLSFYILPLPNTSKKCIKHIAKVTKQPKIIDSGCTVHDMLWDAPYNQVEEWQM
jgi:hypothetical protein